MLESKPSGLNQVALLVSDLLRLVKFECLVQICTCFI